MSVKAAQLHNTLSSLTPVPEVLHNSHPPQYHQPHLHAGHAPAGGQESHIHHLEGQGHNFSVDSLMTAQQHQQMASDSREGSPNSAEDAGAPSANYRNSAVSAADSAAAAACAALRGMVTRNSAYRLRTYSMIDINIIYNIDTNIGLSSYFIDLY